MRAEVICGDAAVELARLPDASVDAVVTDPPYALTFGKNSTKGFMGATWDHGQVAHDPAFWAEVLRVAKPGAFLLAFGGTRTYHRLACAIEDAGWECRDMLNWLQGSGFPKSQSCLKPSHEPILMAKAPGLLQPLRIDACRVPAMTGDRTDRVGGTAQKWGTNTYARDTYSVNVRGSQSPAHDGGRWPPNTLLSHHPDCRHAGMRRVKGAGWRDSDGAGGQKMSPGAVMGNRQSALPRLANGHHTDVDGYEQVEAWTCVAQCPIRLLDEQAGPRTSGKGSGRSWGYAEGTYEGWKRQAHAHYPPKDKDAYYGDTGSASRFFPTFGGAAEPEDAVPFRYVPKASRAERSAGLDALPQQPVDRYGECGQGPTPQQTPRVTRMEGNHHPCVKPLNLMSWLAKLVAKPGDLILDPFCGSGSTGVACVREGFGFIGVEMGEEYAAIARARIAHEQERRDGPLFAGASAQEAVGAR